MVSSNITLFSDSAHTILFKYINEIEQLSFSPVIHILIRKKLFITGKEKRCQIRIE